MRHQAPHARPVESGDLRRCRSAPFGVVGIWIRASAELTLRGRGVVERAILKERLRPFFLELCRARRASRGTILLLQRRPLGRWSSSCPRRRRTGCPRADLAFTQRSSTCRFRSGEVKASRRRRPPPPGRRLPAKLLGSSAKSETRCRCRESTCRIAETAELVRRVGPESGC